MRDKAIISALTLMLSPLYAFAGEEGDNSVLRSIQFKDYNYIRNIADGSVNPVATGDIPLKDLLILDAGFKWGNGSFHAPDAGGHKIGGGVDVYGFLTSGKVAFEGDLSYRNETEDSKCWNSTLYQSKLNPFVLADAMPSDYSTERFHAMGKVSYDITGNWRVALNADYNVGVMSDESDPRLETKGMRFVINPGVRWSISRKLSVGATGGLNLFNESLRYSCLQTAVNYPFYAMSGLGTYYPQSGSSYSRDSKGTSWFVGIDGQYDFSDKVGNYLQLGYDRHNENSTDGGSTYQFKAGEYMNSVFRLENRISISAGRNVHNIGLKFESNDVKGRWYDQKSVTINGTQYYEVMGSSIKHTESLTGGELSYRFDRLGAEGVSSLTAIGRVGFVMSDTKNYPEVYSREYTRVNIGGDIRKHFNIRKVRMSVGADVAYDMALSGSSNFAGQELADVYSVPMYSWLTSDFFSVNAKVEASWPVKAFILGAYVGGGVNYCTGGITDMYKNRSLASATCGLTFSF